MTTDTKPAGRRRRKVAPADPTPPGPVAPTPEQEAAKAERAETRALVQVFGAITDADKVAPLDRTASIALEALAFAAGERGHEGLRQRIHEMKAELMGMMWE